MSELNIDIPLDSNPDPQALEETSRYAERLIKDRTPVQTGNLKKRWKVVLTSNGLEVDNSATYASYVEYGTSKMTPRHMVSDAIPAIREYYQKQAALRQRITQRQQQRASYRQNPGTSKAVASAANRLAKAIADGILSNRRTADNGISLDLNLDIDAILGR